MSSVKLKLLLAFNSVSDLLDRAYRNFDVLRSELLLANVSPEHWHRFTVHNYDRNQLFHSDQHHQRVFPWEKACFDDFFPAPSGRVLVGGAGSGREMSVLMGMGYRVAGFEPAAALVARGREILSPEALLGFDVGGYEELVDGRLEVARRGPFDAVVLGWGSLSHVASAATRERLFRMLPTLCPDGPVLLSWIEAKPVGKKRDRLRRGLSRIGSATPSANDSFRPHMGFIHALDRDELVMLAALADREVVRVGAGPHAVLLPRAHAH